GAAVARPRGGGSQNPADLGVGQRREVLHPPELRSRGQKVVEMPAPSGRIFSATKAADPCPIKNAFDPAAHSTAGLRSCFPQWLDDLHHQADIDRRNGQLAEYGIDVHHKRTAPLLAMSSIAPGVLMAPHLAFTP